ncbi:MAG: transporter substrate-binding domain-containing protein [Gammaproteobacteria bacterium]
MSAGNIMRLLCALSVFVYCADNSAARTLQQIRNSGELRVAVALASPWTMRDRDGEFLGYEIDIARALAADLGTQVRFVVYANDELATAVEIGEADIIIAALPITAERALQVNFSAPHTSGGLTLATHLESTRTVESLADLDDPAYSLAVVAGSGAIELARRLLPRIEVHEYDTPAEAAEALVAGDVDAYLEEEPVPNFLALENAGRIDVPIARPLLERRAGFAIARGDPDFLSFLNAWIVAREDDTWLPTTYRYWFRSLRWRERLGNVPDF